jgi:beta-catenin-like protein 1
MESEVELHETIQEMHAVATVPDLYPIMVELQAVPSLLELLAHENTDIAVAVVDLLQVSLHMCPSMLKSKFGS